ncbi:MAG: 2,3-bisphosphoglycerate-independent phosphoglycerate mutase [Bacilli bacterium]
MKKIILIVLDGFGLSDKTEGNAIKQAATPNIDSFLGVFPHAELNASGVDVGLPKNQMGNSEVGHMTIGSGRVIKQPLSIINDKIKSKEFFSNEKLIDVMNHVKENNSTLHLIGLLSSGGVHSSSSHFYAALAMAKLQHVNKVVFHFITDGRDSSVMGAKKFIADFMAKAEKLQLGVIGSISGRYYAMDRANEFNRIKKAYDAMCYGQGNYFRTYNDALDVHYKNGITDEFINPSIITKGAEIKDNDSVLFINFRPDRMKQLIDAMCDVKFNVFKTKRYNNVKFCSIFKLHNSIDYAYELETINNTFGEYIAGLDFKQARISETEKYNHVTFFFDGCKILMDKSINKIIVPSLNIPTYDKKPEMSLGDVTSNLLSIMEDDYDFILCNFANPDMVGHTGNLKATMDAIEICDFCLGKIFEKSMEHLYDLVIVSDHGNAERLLNSDGSFNTEHTTSKVPFIICSDEYKLKEEGSLSDVIPTIIDMYDIKKPDEMTGKSLLIK